MVALEIRATGIDQQVNSLSGGNQQKVSIGKWLAAQCDLLIIDEPTIGVDIGAKEYIHQLIWNLAAEEGKSIILISSDMPEIINVACRILSSAITELWAKCATTAPPRAPMTTWPMKSAPTWRNK